MIIPNIVLHLEWAYAQCLGTINNYSIGVSVEYYLDLQEAAALSGFSDCNFFLGEPSPINILQASGMCGHDLLCEDW